MQAPEVLSLGVIIPVYNEEKNIKPLVTKVIVELKDVPHTICLVDDGSRDQTVPIIQSLQKEHPQIHLIQRTKTRSGCQRGGASLCALKWLVENTSHEVITEVDADGAHRPEELLNGIRCIRLFDVDIVIASKYLYTSVVQGRPFSRRIVSFCYSLLARVLFNKHIRDYSNSFRFYSRRAAEYILKVSPHYTSPIYLLEVLVMLIAGGFQILEIPTQYIERNEGSSKVKWTDVMKGFFCMLNIAVQFRFKKYQIEHYGMAPRKGYR